MCAYKRCMFAESAWLHSNILQFLGKDASRNRARDLLALLLFPAAAYYLLCLASFKDSLFLLQMLIFNVWRVGPGRLVH
eukprot:12431506-Karenia_brevis.AAC.1